MVGLLLGITLAAPAAYAATGRAGDTITVRENQTIRDDLYAAGEAITVAGTVEGDVVAVGGEVVVNGRVTGSVWAAGATVRITGEVGGSVRTAGSEVSVSGTVEGDVVAAGSTVTVASDGTVGRDLAAAGSEVAVRGVVGRDVLVGAEQLTVAGRVGGDIRGETGGPFRLESTARIGGGIRYSGTEQLSRAAGAQVAGTVDFTKETSRSDEDSLADRLGGQVYWFLASVLLLLAILLYARRAALRAGALIGERPGTSFLAGLGFLLLTPLVAGILLISIVGIPLSLLTLFGYVLVLYTAKVFVALAVGRLMVRKLPDAFWLPFGAGTAGLALYYFLSVLPGVGPVVIVGTVLFGTGAQLLLFGELYRANRKKYGS